MLNLNDLVFFVAAVEQGGFAAASRRLGIPKSTLSKRVAVLEEELATRLIQRSSRSFHLTEVGRDFYEHARAALIETEAAEAVVRSRQAEPSGTVRLTASVPVAQLYLAPNLPRLAQLYPKLGVQLNVTDRFVDVAQEGIDIAVRSHFAPLPDSELVQRLLTVEPIILVAAPGYVHQREALLEPMDLAGHEGLMTAIGQSSWNLQKVSGERWQVAPRVGFVANESSVLIQAAVAGLGITCLPERMCREALVAGTLLRVLPEWTAGSVSTSLVMPHRRGQLPAVRATVEFLSECFAC